MPTPTLSPEQVHSAHRLGVSLKFEDAPVTLARLTELLDAALQRIEALEQRPSGRR